MIAGRKLEVTDQLLLRGEQEQSPCMRARDTKEMLAMRRDGQALLGHMLPHQASPAFLGSPMTTSPPYRVKNKYTKRKQDHTSLIVPANRSLKLNCRLFSMWVHARENLAVSHHLGSSAATSALGKPYAVDLSFGNWKQGGVTLGKNINNCFQFLKSK